MKYQWLEKGNTCEELSKELGCKVKSISEGSIIIGYTDESKQIPITRKGIEIELEDESPEALEKLDRKFINLKREGGKSLSDEMADLKADITSMKADLTKLQVRTKKS